MAGSLVGWLTGEPLRLRREQTSWLTTKVMAGIVVVLLVTGSAAAAAPRLGEDYKVHLALIEIIRDMGAKEETFSAYAKSIRVSQKTEQASMDDLRVFAQKMQATYTGFPERLATLQPTSQGLKQRKQLLTSYVKYKDDAAELYLKSAETQDAALADEALKKLKSANTLIAEFKKPFTWYR